MSNDFTTEELINSLIQIAYKTGNTKDIDLLTRLNNARLETTRLVKDLPILEIVGDMFIDGEHEHKFTLTLAVKLRPMFDDFKRSKYAVDTLTSIMDTFRLYLNDILAGLDVQCVITGSTLLDNGLSFRIVPKNI